MSRTIYIYGLVDPRNQHLRYVGRTTNMKRRLRQHLDRLHRVESNPHLTHWIALLHRNNLSPEIFVIEEVNENGWAETEKFWIGYFRFLGCDLINMSDGGEGSPGHRVNREAMRKVWEKAVAANRGRKRASPDEEVKQRISASLKKRFAAHPQSEEVRKKISQALRGKPKTKEHIAKVSRALKGRTLPQCQRDQLSRMNLGRPGPKHSPEVVEKIRQKTFKQWENWRNKNGGKRVPLDYKKDI